MKKRKFQSLRILSERCCQKEFRRGSLMAHIDEPWWPSRNGSSADFELSARMYYEVEGLRRHSGNFLLWRWFQFACGM